jgi:hypothetical protein
MRLSFPQRYRRRLQFGTILALRLMQNPQFQRDMAAAKTELQAANFAS